MSCHKGCALKDSKKMIYHYDKSSFLYLGIAFIPVMEYNHT